MTAKPVEGLPVVNNPEPQPPPASSGPQIRPLDASASGGDPGGSQIDNSVKPPAKSNKDSNAIIDRSPAAASAPSYDDLVQQAKEAIRANKAPEAMQYLQQAVRLDPNKPTSYQWMGFVQLYSYQDINSAEQNFRPRSENSDTLKVCCGCA